MREGRLALDLHPHHVPDLLWAAHEGMRVMPSPPRESTSSLRHQPLQGSDVTSTRNRIGQVLTNLLTNALRHTPRRTVILAANRQGEEAAISVIDNGDGMTPNNSSTPSNGFYRGDAARTRDRTGSGIGLTISKALIDAHHGSISAISDGHGEGTRLIFTLPLPGR